MQKDLLYKIFYNPFLNFVLRNFFRTFNEIFKTNLTFSVSGSISCKVGNNKRFKLKLNESSSAHIYFWKKPQNIEYTILFAKLIEDKKTFMDIGANIGYYTAIANAINPDIIVYAFEPADGPYKYLSENKKLNGWRNTTISKIALSNSAGKTIFFEGFRRKYNYLKYHLSGIGATQNTHQIEDMRSYDVQKETLDNFISNFNIKSIDVIKIDTEATENTVLEGGRSAILKYKPIIICEVLNGFIENEMKALVDEFGYQIYECINNKLIRRESFIDKEIVERNFLLIHPSKNEQITDFIS